MRHVASCLGTVIMLNIGTDGPLVASELGNPTNPKYWDRQA